MVQLGRLDAVCAAGVSLVACCVRVACLCGLRCRLRLLLRALRVRIRVFGRISPQYARAIGQALCSILDAVLVCVCVCVQPTPGGTWDQKPFNTRRAIRNMTWCVIMDVQLALVLEYQALTIRAPSSLAVNKQD